MARKAFTGGDALQNRLAELTTKIKAAATVNVGFLEGATYPDGTSVAMVAAIQELGAPAAGIPPRPFIRNMIAKESGHWGDDVGRALAANDYDAGKALDLMGQEIVAELRQSIIDTNTPPLSEVTLMLRKMRSADPNLKVTGATVGEAARRVAAGETSGLSGTAAKPLVYSGDMLNAVDHEVKS